MESSDMNAQLKSGSHTTPGPWDIATDSYGVERIWAGEYDVACCQGDGSIDKEHRTANARLIAAAPDLLEALRVLLSVTNPHARNKAASDKAIAALAKAGV